uniref:Uncharacterized protein n=1 Tax=Acrobeloides nanus TaxID=290746 RepID=A0A914DHU7_9BILA
MEHSVSKTTFYENLKFIGISFDFNPFGDTVAKKEITLLNRSITEVSFIVTKEDIAKLDVEALLDENMDG